MTEKISVIFILLISTLLIGCVDQPTQNVTIAPTEQVNETILEPSLSIESVSQRDSNLAITVMNRGNGTAEDVFVSVVDIYGIGSCWDERNNGAPTLTSSEKNKLMLSGLHDENLVITKPAKWLTVDWEIDYVSDNYKIFVGPLKPGEYKEVLLEVPTHSYIRTEQNIEYIKVAYTKDFKYMSIY